VCKSKEIWYQLGAYLGWAAPKNRNIISVTILILYAESRFATNSIEYVYRSY